MYPYISDYFGLWLVYLAGSLGLMAVFWRITRWIPWIDLKHLLRLLLAVILLTPVAYRPEAEFLAPAWGVAVLDALQGESAARAGQMLLIAGLSAIILAFGIEAARRWWQQRQPPAGPRQEPALD